MAAKKEVNEADLNEIENIIKKEGKKSETKAVPIIFDGKQYSIRIPKNFVDSLGVDKNKDKFLFELEIPKKLAEKPGIRGHLVRNYDEKKKI